MTGRSGPRVKALADVSTAVAKAARPPERTPWLALDGWRRHATLPGEALLAALQENA